MIISVNWLKQFTPIDLPINELATLIGARLVEVEGVENIGEKYKDVVIVKVVECDAVQGSDHLNLTRIDDGGVVKNVERGDDGLVQVVCGAPNVRAGMWTAWLPPKSTVPETFGDAEPFVLEARNLRGHTSNGMLASAKELGLYEDHAGIFEVPPAQAGASFADLYQLNDYLLDIENKSLTHRPDAFGIIGFAREVAAIQGEAFTTPAWLADTHPAFKKTGSIDAPKVTIDDASLSARYQAVVLEGVTQVSSSLELPLAQTLLGRSGVRPISAIVDVTNYLMLLTGQPLHAFDYDKLLKVGGGTIDIHVRTGRDGEKLTLLDGRDITLTPSDIVIDNAGTAVALAGAMGGADTEIDEHTTRILLESATFDLYRLRATQMRHGIFSEAVTRFTKGQPAELTAPVLAEAVRLLGEYVSATQAGEVAESYPGKHAPITVEVPSDAINVVLGSDFDIEIITRTLENVEFSATPVGEMLHVTVPYWRQDIHIPEDVVEEVGRLNGFDEIGVRLPLRTFAAVQPSDFDRFAAEVRRLLVRAGASELTNFSFVHGDLLKKAHQSDEGSYKIVNSISPELQYYRQTLTPSLLDKVNQNLRQKFDEFALFEINKVHQKGVMDELEPELPAEATHLALTLAANKKQAAGRGSAYYQAKKILEFVAHAVGARLSFVPLDDSSPLSAPFEPKRSAAIAFDGVKFGVIGEYKRSVSGSFKLPDYAAGFELDLAELFAYRPGTAYHPASRYPGTEQDVCFQVSSDTTYGQVIEAVQAALDTLPLETTVQPVDIYQAVDASTKNITVRIQLTSANKTLTSDEASAAITQVTDAVASSVHATII